MSATPENLLPTEMQSDPRYIAAVNIWCHLDQVRHTTLYNYLMASTILLLAWGTIFSASIPTPPGWRKLAGFPPP